jgi:hypothetical protein
VRGRKEFDKQREPRTSGGIYPNIVTSFKSRAIEELGRESERIN